MNPTSSLVIRLAKPEDVASVYQLIVELAAYERAPQEVTVTLEHFEESGFGPNPVYWAFVAETSIKTAKTINKFFIRKQSLNFLIFKHQHIPVLQGRQCKRNRITGLCER